MTRPDFKLPGRLCQKHRRALDDRLSLVRERISAGALLADYRPYRTRHPQESGPATGDASTIGNIPTGVALIKRSHG